MTYMRTLMRLTLVKELQAWTDSNPPVDVSTAVVSSTQRASELSTTKKDKEVVEESLGDKPEVEDDVTGLGRVPMILLPQMLSQSGVPEH